MSSELYPELNEHGEKNAQILIDKFKERLIKVASETIDDLYVDLGAYIECDHWTNYRNQIMNGLKGYGGDLRWDFKKVREEIFKEHREEIIKDLNQDLLAEIEDLKSQIRNMTERKYY